MLAIVALAVAWIAIRPLPVPVLIPALESALSDADDGNQVSLEGASLAWAGLQSGLEIRLDGVKVIGPEGVALAEFDSMRLELAPGQLLYGRIAPRALVFEAPAIHLMRNPDGTMATGIGRGRTGSADATGLLPSLLRDLMSEESPERPSSYLRTLAARNADISLDDRVREMSWRADPVDIEIQRDGQGFCARADLALHATPDPERPAGGESQVKIEARARALREGPDLTLELAADLEAFDVATLGSWWPRVAAAEAREWVVTNIPAGTADTAHLDLGLRLLESDPSRASLDSLAARVEASDVRVDYLAPLPPATDLRATLDFGAERFDFAIHGGAVEDVEIESGTVAITDLQQETSRIEIETQVRGPSSTLLRILDADPLHLLTDTFIEHASVSGETEATLGFAFPLGGDLGLEDVKMNGKGKLHRLAVDNLPLQIAEGELDLVFSEQKLQIRGPMRIEGLAASFSWNEEFGRGAASQRIIQVAMDAPQTAFDYASQGADMTFSFHTADPGGLLEAFDWSDRLEGGTLQVDGQRKGLPGALTGHFRMSEFEVMKANWLLSLTTALTVQGFIDSLKGESFPIDVFEGEFRYQGDELELLSVTVRGSYGVISADGKLQLDERHMDVRGTFVPLTTLNRWIKHVPVLGELFMGIDEEGVFVADFVAKGPLEHPKVNVSRTSPAPGILRDLAESLTHKEQKGEEQKGEQKAESETDAS